MTFQLRTKNRSGKELNADIRAEGDVPAIFYGQGKPAVMIRFSQAEFIKIFREAGESSIINLETESGLVQVLVQDVQQDPVSGQYLHVDFKIVEAGKPIEVTVPLEFIGEAPAVKIGGGILAKSLQEIEIEVLPLELPHVIQVDISSLQNADDQILAKDIKLPAGTLITDPETVVAVITQAHEETDEAPTTIDFSKIEVQKKGKEEKPEDAE